jgi:hypothetical protein
MSPEDPDVKAGVSMYQCILTPAVMMDAVLQVGVGWSEGGGVRPKYNRGLQQDMGTSALTLLFDDYEPPQFPASLPLHADSGRSC